MERKECRVPEVTEQGTEVADGAQLSGNGKFWKAGQVPITTGTAGPSSREMDLFPLKKI